MELQCPTCNEDTVRFWQRDYGNVRRILNRHQQEAADRQTSIKSPTAQ